MAPMNFSTAEELDQQKNEISKQRIRKLKDRQSPHGNVKLAQTDGLRTIKPHGNGKRKQSIVIDDVEFDPRRIRSLRDVEPDDEGIEE